MPALRCCRKKWGIASNDFVTPALVALILRLVWTGTAVALTIHSFFLKCTSLPAKVCVAYLFGQVLLHSLVAVTEVMILCESSRGPILEMRSELFPRRKWRRRIPLLLYIRCTMFVLEVGVWLVAMVLTSHGSWLMQGIRCSQQAKDAIITGQWTYNILYGIFLLLLAVLVLVLMDPLGCCGTSIFSQEHRKLSQNIQKDCDQGKKGAKVDVARASSAVNGGQSNHQHPGHSFWLKVVNSLLCCFRNRGAVSSHKSIEEQIALALAVLFENQDDLVLTDVWAAFVLVRNHHKQKLSKDSASVAGTQTCVENEMVAMMRRYTFNTMAMDDFVNGKDQYEYLPPQTVDMSIQINRLLLQEALHYFAYAQGMYGWKLYAGFQKPCTGLCHLLCGARCCCQRHEVPNVECDDSNLDTTALNLTASVEEEEHLFYASWEVGVYQSPFSVLFDPDTNCIVVAIRGTLSIQEILTDFAVEMVPLEKDDTSNLPVAYQGLDNMVHHGMYTAAKAILAKLTANNKSASNLLEEAFGTFRRATEASTGLKRLTIVGHSLGAGIASILALLLRPCYPALKCLAFSPPGCVFSFALATYSKAFVTSFVIGNDNVPRMNWRSLLFLRKSLVTRLKECKKPKHMVLCPSCFGCCFPEYYQEEGARSAQLHGDTPAESRCRPQSRGSLSLDMGRKSNRVAAMELGEMSGNGSQRGVGTLDDRLLDEVFTNSFDTSTAPSSSVSNTGVHPLATFSEELQSILARYGPRVSPVGCEDASLLYCSNTDGTEEGTGTSDKLYHDSVIADTEEDDEVFKLEQEHALPLPNAVVSPMSSCSASISYSHTSTAGEKDQQSMATKAGKTSRHSTHSTTSGGCNTFALGRMGSYWRGKTTVTKAVRQMKKVSRVPAFIPGRVLLIEEEYSTATRHRFLPFLKSKMIGVSEVANEDFCFLDLGKGSFTNHFPTRVADMLKKTCKTASDLDSAL